MSNAEVKRLNAAPPDLRSTANLSRLVRQLLRSVVKHSVPAGFRAHCTALSMQVQATLDGIHRVLDAQEAVIAPAGLPPFEEEFLSDRVMSARGAATPDPAHHSHFRPRANGTEHGIILQGGQTGLSSVIAAAAASDNQYASLFSGAPPRRCRSARASDTVPRLRLQRVFVAGSLTVHIAVSCAWRAMTELCLSTYIYVGGATASRGIERPWSVALCHGVQSIRWSVWLMCSLAHGPATCRGGGATGGAPAQEARSPGADAGQEHRHAL